VLQSFSTEDRFFWSIGRFVCEFSDLEFTIKGYIANEVGLNDEYFTQVLSHDFSMACTIAQDVLSRGASEKRKTELKALISKCRALNDHRVRIVHGLWRVGRPEGSLLHAPRQNLRTSSYYEDVSEVQNLADEASKLVLDLWDWVNKEK
jgi:hypothetical protein